MRTFATLIDDLGGYAVLADVLAIPRSTASVMRTRNSIPPEYWATVIAAAAAKGLVGVDLDELARMRGPRKRRGDRVEVAA